MFPDMWWLPELNIDQVCMLSHSVVSNSLWPHGLKPARLLGPLEWVAISFSRGSSRPRDQTHVSCVSCIAGRFFTLWQADETQRHTAKYSDLEHFGWGGIEDYRRVQTKRRKAWREHEGGSPKSNLVSHLLCWKPALPNKYVWSVGSWIT